MPPGNLRDEWGVTTAAREFDGKPRRATAPGFHDVRIKQLQ